MVKKADKKKSSGSRKSLLSLSIIVGFTALGGIWLWRSFEDPNVFSPPLRPFMAFLAAIIFLLVESIRIETPAYFTDLRNNAMGQLQLIKDKTTKRIINSRPSKASQTSSKAGEHLPRISELEEENIELKKMYADLSIAHRRLKKQLAKLRSQNKKSRN